MKNKNKAVWGSRFNNATSKIFEKIGASIDIDKRLFEEDIFGSIVHTQMLVKQKIINKKRGNKIISGLKKIREEIRKNKFNFNKKYEDIHQNVEKRLFAIIGDDAGYLHIARSRNDQVITDFKLWIKKASVEIINNLNNLIKILDLREAKKTSREKIVYLCTGSQGEPNGAMMRISNYIHPDVMIESGDTVIFSSKIIPGNEKKLYKLHNQLVKNGIDVVSEENEFVHVSGHPNREDLKDMYNWVKPKSVIPVHGEHRHMFDHINFAKEMQVPYPVKVENGDIVQLFPGEKPKVFDKAPVGRIYVDGNVSVGEESQSIKDRKNLSYNGFLEITVIINESGSIVKKPIISFKGIPNNEENSNFVFELEDKIRKICKTFSLKNSHQEQNLIEALKFNCRKTVKEKTGKRPYTNVNLVRI